MRYYSALHTITNFIGTQFANISGNSYNVSLKIIINLSYISIKENTMSGITEKIKDAAMVLGGIIYFIAANGYIVNAFQ